MKTFHVSLCVEDLERAIDRYRAILGIEPAKVRADFAKFELSDPPLILSLNIGGAAGTLSHLGIRHEDSEHVDTDLARSRAAGLEIEEQKGTTCCYAKADKFWVKDADGIAWEMYSLLGDADVHSLPDAAPRSLAPQPAAKPGCCG